MLGREMKNKRHQGGKKIPVIGRSRAALRNTGRSRVFNDTFFSAFNVAAAALIVLNIAFLIFALVVTAPSGGHSVSPAFFRTFLGIVVISDIFALSSFLIDRVSFLTRVWREITVPIEKLEHHLNDIYNEYYDKEVVYYKDNEIGDMYKKVNSIRVKLRDYQAERERNVDARRTLVSGLLHDVATPVTRINGCASMIRDGMITDPDSIREYAGTIVDNTEYISDLLNKLNPAVKLDENVVKSRTMPVRIVPLLRRCVQSLEPDLRLSDTFCEFEDECVFDPVCEIDVRSLRRVVNNLLYNSSKYKKPDRPCRIVVTCSIADESSFLVTFADNGVGVKPGNEKKIFDMFYREETSRSNLVGGNGVGLYVCKEAIRAFGGRIWAENNADGLTVSVTLPLTDKEPIDISKDAG